MLQKVCYQINCSYLPTRVFQHMEHASWIRCFNQIQGILFQMEVAKGNFWVLLIEVWEMVQCSSLATKALPLQASSALHLFQLLRDGSVQQKGVL